MFNQRINGRSLAVAAAVSLAFGAASGYAADATSNLSVTATVAANCSISTSPVAFGAYDPVTANASSPLDGTGSVTVTCTSGASTGITLGQGANADASSTDDDPIRRMTDGTNFLGYDLYSDASRTAIWGNTVATDVPHTGAGIPTTLTVYGQIAAGQNVPPGSYSDTVVATVTF